MDIDEEDQLQQYIDTQLKGRKNGKHHWSGWPGAWCLDCGCADPTEICIGGDNVDDSHPGWKDCAHPGENHFNPYIKKEK